MKNNMSIAQQQTNSTIITHLLADTGFLPDGLLSPAFKHKKKQSAKTILNKVTINL